MKLSPRWAIKIRRELNEIENRKIIKQIKKIKSLFFDKKVTDNSLAKLMKEK